MNHRQDLRLSSSVQGARYPTPSPFQIFFQWKKVYGFGGTHPPPFMDGFRNFFLTHSLLQQHINSSHFEFQNVIPCSGKTICDSAVMIYGPLLYLSTCTICFFKILASEIYRDWLHSLGRCPRHHNDKFLRPKGSSNQKSRFGVSQSIKITKGLKSGKRQRNM